MLKTEPEWGAVPAGMRPLVRRCLEKNVRQRLRDIGDARMAVEEQLGGEAGSPGIVAPLARMPVLPWTVAGIAITISLLLGVVLWRATRPTTQPLMWLTVEPGPEFATAGFGEANVILPPDGTRLVYGGRGAGREGSAIHPRTSTRARLRHWPEPKALRLLFFSGRAVCRVFRRGQAEEDFGRGARTGSVVRCPDW